MLYYLKINLIPCDKLIKTTKKITKTKNQT